MGEFNEMIVHICLSLLGTGYAKYWKGGAACKEGKKGRFIYFILMARRSPELTPIGIKAAWSACKKVLREQVVREFRIVEAN
jgi:hypothetical protein